MKLTEEERIERRRECARRSARKNYAKNYPKSRAWLAANPEKRKLYNERVQEKRRQNIEVHRGYEREKYRIRFFRQLGITDADYNRMFAQQDGRCWICSSESATHKTSPEKRLVIDHDHMDGTVRGLLCQKCNKALGLFNDDLALLVQAVHYLTKHAKELAA